MPISHRYRTAQRRRAMMIIMAAAICFGSALLRPRPVAAAAPNEYSAPPVNPAPCYVPAPAAISELEAWVPARQTRQPELETRRPMLTVLSAGANVRSGPSIFYETVGSLGWRTEREITGRYGRWWRIDYEGAEGWIADAVVAVTHPDCVPDVTPAYPVIDPSPYPITPPATAPSEITENKWIDVDLSEQRVRIYDHGIVIHSYLISSGLPHTPTPQGQFRIWLKLRYDDMEGDDYYLRNVPYVMYFYQGYGLHGVWWHANFGHRMSHGCINQPNAQAAWLFNWAELGTLVNVHE